MDILKSEVGRARSNVDYTEVMKWNEHKLRVRIRRNSYDFQSHALIERWNGEEWKGVDSIHFSKMQTPEYLNERDSDEVLKAHFSKDTSKLISLAMEVLDE